MQAQLTKAIVSPTYIFHNSRLRISPPFYSLTSLPTTAHAFQTTILRTSHHDPYIYRLAAQPAYFLAIPISDRGVNHQSACYNTKTKTQNPYPTSYTHSFSLTYLPSPPSSAL
ncbi:uncharacterized protein K452DRAFT_155653 [Aplosporella prunicola CBS 121167]|uniref:Uncharacterized protein n=1 Tax=Aplosporella prunicola CBS 121167 TaxID=1176127 RepID=A0A6A6BLV0_9PEZI|nr:uncharacterized protein K452DRAFT_155653 [Aplosporella prunicola CBS 121167]KAF2144265.1 hypothetical protein K452DRAFT_155653 [Aplosporella prunicola CBS 121167]